MPSHEKHVDEPPTVKETITEGVSRVIKRGKDEDGGGGDPKRAKHSAAPKNAPHVPAEEKNGQSGDKSNPPAETKNSEQSTTALQNGDHPLQNGDPNNSLQNGDPEDECPLCDESIPLVLIPGCAEDHRCYAVTK